MLTLRNTTSLNRVSSIPSSANDPGKQTALAQSLLGTANSSHAMFNHSGVAPTVHTGSNAGIAPPVLACSTFTTNPDFLDQNDLDYQWSSIQEQLKTITLSEQEALEVLRSGILQTATGKALAGLFADAMLRSLRPLGSLDSDRLKEIVDVLCHWPPGQWQAALGENIRFSDGQHSEGVKGFVQSQLDRSSALRDERMANDELLSDAHWEALKTLAEKGRQYIRSNDGKVDSALMMLEDAHELRPSPKDAYAQLETFIRHLEEGDVKRVRWTGLYVAEVKALRDQLKPLESAKPTWLEWVIGPSWLESLFNGPTKTSGATNPSQAPVKALKSVDSSNWLLSGLQRFERNADFYSNITANGPRIPDTFVGRLLYVCNVLDTFGALRLDSSHILPVRPDPVVAENAARPIPEPNSDAWKNGASDFSRSLFAPAAGQPSASGHVDAMTAFTQFIAKADELFTRSLVPWNSASAVDLKPSDVAIEMEKPLKDVYQTTTDMLSGPPLVVEVVRQQVQGLLQRMAASLVGTGAAVLGNVGDLVERNPGRTAGAFAAYVAISNLYAHWFEPEVEEMVDPLQGLELTPEAAPYEDTGVDEHIIEGIEDLFKVFPEFKKQVEEPISQSDYSDPADDPDLHKKLELLLQSIAPGTQHLTYQEYLDEIVIQAQKDAADEKEAAGETTTEPDSTADASPLPITSELALTANIRKKRSLDDASLSSSLHAAHSSIKWVIQAGQRLLDANEGIGAGEEIAPGITISQAANLFIDDFVELQTVLDPSLFIASFTEHLIAGSDLPADLKLKVNYKTQFSVEYYLERPDSKYRHASPDKIKRYKVFTLAELLMGRHDKQAVKFESVKVLWPNGYTDGFKKSVGGTNLWGDYKERSEKLASQPKFSRLWTENVKFKLQHLVSDYLNGAGISERGREIGIKFLTDEIKVRPVAIREGKYSSLITVPNAVFLCTSNQGRDAREGLFVFLGRNESVIESPVELFEEDGKSIEEFPALRKALSDRIPLKDLLGRDDDDFKYSQGRFVWGWNPIGMFENYKWPYKPIEFGRKDGPTHYGERYDAFAGMFKDVLDKTRSDMDALTSTWGERVIDGLLEILSESLKWGAIILALPGAPTAGMAFLMGASASATQYVRGEINDDPLEANRHKANAVKGMVAQIAAPHISKLLGKIFSKAVDSRIAGKIYEYFRFSEIFPKQLARQFPQYKHASSPLSANANKIEKWIAPRVRHQLIIQDKLDRKLTNKLVVDRLNSLGKGPQVAQRLMDRSRVLYFANPKEGYVYRGFTMRGDMRAPQDVFTKGFKSNKAQASGYYDYNGMGAFHSGGKQGGWTYLVDGRDFNGKDVLRNMNWKAGSGARLGSNPYQVNYGKDIPGANVLGAYDRTGKFIPNPDALSRAIEKSGPIPFMEKVPFPIKNLVQNMSSTHTPIRLPQ